jgi:hypothetical protein
MRVSRDYTGKQKSATMQIESYSFGTIRIDGRVYSTDVVLLGDDVKNPWWREAGGHVYAVEDLSEVLEAAPEVVVLGTGYFGRVKVLDETIEALAKAGSEIVVEKTGGAVEYYNRFTTEGRDVAAALHLTC